MTGKNPEQEEKRDIQPGNQPTETERNRSGAAEKEYEEAEDLQVNAEFWQDKGKEDTEDDFYEKRRQQRHERNVARRKKRRRARIASVTALLVLILFTVGYFFGGKELVIEGTQELIAKATDFFQREKEYQVDPEIEKIFGDEEIEKAASEDTEAAEASARVASNISESPEEKDASKKQTDTEEKETGEAGSESPTDEEAAKITQAAELTKSAEITQAAKLTQAAEKEAAAKEAEKQRIIDLYKAGKAMLIQYDYDGDIALLKADKAYKTNKTMHKTVKKIQAMKDACVEWEPSQVTHVFFHSLIVKPSKAFDGDYKQDGYNQMMTTISEFNKIIQSMYDKGYVMVNLYDLAEIDKNGKMKTKKILLPEGKTPFVLSQDDVSYYHSMEGDGFASRLIVDEEGRIRNEYVTTDGKVKVGDYDMIPLIDRFVEEHPDFSYHGHKGIIALTGYNGILGYRTDISYQTRPADLDVDKAAWLDAHPEFDLETERKGAKEVADAMKAEGWTFASHTWGHKNMSSVSMERLRTDTKNFKANVDPLIGGTDIIIFAFGADINTGGEYTGEEKFEYLKSQGYDYYCNVDSNQYFVQITDQYFRQGRRNLDGYRMYYNPELVSDLFDASKVFDKARPVPVPPMNSSSG